MESLQTKIDSIRAKAQADVAKAEREAEIMTAVSAAMGLGPENWKAGSFHAAWADCFVTYEAETLADAMLIAERAGPVALYRFKDSCTSYRPFEALKPREIEAADAGRAEYWLITPYVLHLERFQNRKTLEFYVMAGPWRVNVRVEIKAEPLIYWHVQPAQHDSRGRVTTPERITVVNKSGHLNRCDYFWSSEAAHKTAYLWSL